MKGDLGAGFFGGYFAYLDCWIGVATEIIELARATRKEQRRKRAAELRLRQAAERRPRSINPPPNAVAVSAQWGRVHESPVEALRFGSLLLDLEPTVDRSLVTSLNRTGTRTVIVARNPGLKGWLHRHCRAVGYKTALRHKNLAERARKACGLPRDVPLEWVLPGVDVASDTDRARQTPVKLPEARVKLTELLSDCANPCRLSAKLDEVLCIAHRRLTTPRGRLNPAAIRRRDERAVEALLSKVRTCAGNRSRPLGAEARRRLLGGLLEVVDGLRESSA